MSLPGPFSRPPAEKARLQSLGGLSWWRVPGNGHLPHQPLNRFHIRLSTTASIVCLVVLLPHTLPRVASGPGELAFPMSLAGYPRADIGVAVGVKVRSLAVELAEFKTSLIPAAQPVSPQPTDGRTEASHRTNTMKGGESTQFVRATVGAHGGRGARMEFRTCRRSRASTCPRRAADRCRTGRRTWNRPGTCMRRGRGACLLAIPRSRSRRQATVMAQGRNAAGEALQSTADPMPQGHGSRARPWETGTHSPCGQQCRCEEPP